jgi:hypothetical protein
MPAESCPAPIERWSLRLNLARPLHHSEHCGSLLRGAFGHALKNLACQCAGEPHQPDCLYQQIFEPQQPAGWPQRYRDCPPAYVITPPPSERNSPAQLDFGLTLLGPMLQQRSLIWYAWQQAARQGLGAARVPAKLEALGHAEHLPESPAGNQIRLQLTSPLLIKRKKTGQTLSAALGPQQLEIEDLLIALHRRLELTQRLYGVPQEPLPALETWLAAVPSLSWVSHLHEHHYSRHSSRQQQHMPLYGLGGEIHINGTIPQSLRDALALGQWLHIGGKTALGLGGYRVIAVSESTVQDRKPM